MEKAAMDSDSSLLDEHVKCVITDRDPNTDKEVTKIFFGYVLEETELSLKISQGGDPPVLIGKRTIVFCKAVMPR